MKPETPKNHDESIIERVHAACDMFNLAFEMK